MRYSPQQSELNRQNILEAAGRQFRANGYGGSVIDGLAKSAGVTSGAVYSHFGSKANIFRAAAVAGLEHLRLAIEQFRTQHADRWFSVFSSFYLGAEHRREVGAGCALPTLTVQVGRSDAETRADYEAELLRVAAALAAGLGVEGQRQVAWPLLAQLAGGVMLARAVNDPALAQEISDAVRDAMLARTASGDC